MAEVNKCSLKEMLIAILGIANIEQNFVYSPSIFSAQYNAVTSLLLSKLADIYPSDSSVVDIIDPFVERIIKRPVNGVIKLPDNYRNILGSPQISAKEDGCAECLPEQSEMVSNFEFKELTLKSGCRKVPLVILDQSEFAYRTTSTYKFPTFDKPIGYFSGKKEITVCPYNINAVQIMYVRNEKLVNYGYDMQPDDTFVYNESKSTETEWNTNAFEPLFTALFAMYSAYTRDNQLRDWVAFIKQNGLV